MIIFHFKSLTMKNILSALILFLLFTSVKAQTEQDSVKTTINNMFTAMKNADTVLLRACFTANPIIQTIGLNKEGKLAVKDEALQEFISSIAKLPKNAADERIVFDAIYIDGVLANIWAPYKFYFNNVFSHCGADNFTLVKLSGEWKIQYLIDTRHKHGCE